MSTHHQQEAHMILTISEKIKVLLHRKGMTIAELASMTNQSRQNLYNKLRTNSLKEHEILEIAAKLNCTFEGLFTLSETNETL